MSVLIFALVSSPAAALLNTYRAGIDLDPKLSTGCNFSLGSIAPGTLPGFELQLTVVVDADPAPPQVVSAQVETCSGAVFADPQPLPGFVAELDSGVLASDSVIGSIPLSLLGEALVVRLAFHALAAGGSEDALFTLDGSRDGPPIVLFLDAPVRAPALSRLGLSLIVIVLLGLAWLRRRYGHWGSVSALLALTIAGGAVVAYAVFGDPLAIDDPDDASPPDTRAEILAAFVMFTDTELALRLDIKDLPFGSSLTESDCTDGIDNDFDGFIDCGDGDCDQRPCNDSEACTINDECSGGVCDGIAKITVPVAEGGCDDGNACTVDTCVGGTCMNSVAPEICSNSIDDDCDDLVDDLDPDCQAPFQVFVTSTLVDGNFGGITGLAAADNLCSALAANAGLPGTFVALISDSTTDAKDRIASDGPWYLVSAFPLGKVADNKADLLDGTIDTSINVDESGNDVSSGSSNSVWTGSTISGVSSGDDCSDWTNASAAALGTTGHVNQSDSDWVDQTTSSCNGSRRLYCFQISQ